MEGCTGSTTMTTGDFSPTYQAALIDNNNINDKGDINHFNSQFDYDHNDNDTDGALSIDLRYNTDDEPRCESFEKSPHQSSRRKQLKPFRVQHTDVKRPSHPEKTSSLEFDVEPQTTSPNDTDVDNAFISCQLCPEQFGTYMAWKSHQKDVHGLNMHQNDTHIDRISPETPESQKSDIPYPTEYHRLGRQLTNESNLPEMPPLLSEKHLEEGIPAGHKDNRFPSMFHQNAYCDYCDREFCNKYFLKKHLASKHGISENGLLQSQQTTNFATDLRPDLPSLMPRQEMPVSYPPNLNSQTSPTITSAGSGLRVPHINLSTVTSSHIWQPRPETSRITELPKTPSPQRLGLSDGMFIDMKNDSADKKIKGLEDFCDLCQKHFCNKYYLRKHKMDVHGIRSDPFSVKRRLANQNMNVNAMANFSTSFPSLHSMPMTQSLPNVMANMMMLNPFAQLAIPPNPSILQGLPHLLPLPSVDREATSPADIEAGEVMPSQDTVENVRGAKCNMCKKYFIDGYFLSVHMMNKHTNNTEIRRSSPSSPSGGYKESFREKNTDLVDGEPPVKKVKQEQEVMESISEKPMDFSKVSSHRPIPPDPFASLPKVERPRTCDLCNKEFADKYSLRMHKQNIHGQLLERPASEQKVEVKPEPRSPNYGVVPNIFIPSSTMTFPPVSLSLPIPSLGGMSLPPNGSLPDANAMSTMFTSMVTAKLADRVTCDICNKEVCNKYFLKTHKIKMHGVDPTLIKDPPKDMRPKIKPMNGLSRSLKQLPPNFLTTPLPIPQPEEQFKNDDLLSMGIDPEAYCEICKKEFCSKYFLRTHKLNMHGIPTDKPGNRKEDREISRRELMEREMMTRREFGFHHPMDFTSVYPTMMGRLPGQVNPLHTSQQELFPTSGYPMPVLTSSLLKDEDSLDSNKSCDSTSNKDGDNSFRCDICDQVQGSKFVLRTHKLYKHGIVDDAQSKIRLETSGSAQKLPFELTPFFMNGKPEYATTVVNNADSSRQRVKDSETVPFHNMFGNFEQEFMKKYHLDTKTPKVVKETVSDKVSYSQVCDICQLRFRSVEWLKTHMFIEHNVKDENVQNELRKKLNDVCQICGMVFHDKLSLQSHLTLEHSAEDFSREESFDLSKSPEQSVTVKEPCINEHRATNASLLKARRNLKSKYAMAMYKSKSTIHSCSYCSYSSSWIANIRSHEEHRHGIHHSYKCSRCFGVYNRHIDYRNHRVKCGKKRFVCRSCSKQLSSKKLLRVHVSKCHKNRFGHKSANYSLKVNKSQTIRHLQLDSVPVTSSALDLSSQSKSSICFAKTNQASESPFFMQPFTLRDETIINQFVNAVVYLPVFEKIHEPLTVHFQLTPTGQ